MQQGNERLLEALSEISDLARTAVNGYEPGSDDADEQTNGAASTPANIGCTIKAVPRRLVVRAAETAVKINPANGLVFGRMVEAQGMMAPEPARIALLVAKYWGPTPRRLTVSFMETTPADLRRRLVSHMNAWTRTGCIEFVETQGTGQVRVSRGRGGYWSYLGTDILHIPNNRPTMNLEAFTMNTRDSEFKRVVRHEAGHTLGFPHEHMRRQLIARLDREKTYAYFLRTQGWDRATVDAQVLTSLDERSIRGTTNADQDSIMCYQLPGEITTDGRPIRGGLDIDASDFDFCGRIYPRAGRTAMGACEEDEWAESEDVEEVVLS